MLLFPFVPISTFFLLHLLCFYQCSHAEIPLGSTLTPSNPNTIWTSPNNTFSLSFIPIQSSYSAAITFTGIPVWKAGGDAALVDSSARFELLRNGNLRLTNGTGNLIWESETSNQGVTSAELDDSGNLSLNNGSISIWSTFENPTDTLLLTQSFRPSKKLQSGLYSFQLLDSGNLTLQWNNSIVYWNQGLNSSFTGANLSSPSFGFQQIGILQLSDPTFSVPVDIFYSSDYGDGNDIFRFIRLDSDGNLRMYTSVSSNVTQKWAAVLDQCRVYGWCGNMGVCSYSDSRPVCGCPSQNFEFLNPNDSRQGCRRKMEIQDCLGNVTMLTLDHTQFLTFPPESTSQVVEIGISACKENCLVGESCIASTSLADGTGQCYLKTLNFVSASHSPALPSTSFVKVCSPALPNLSPFIMNTNQRNSRNVPHAWAIAVVILSALVGLVLLELGLWFWCCKNGSTFGGLSAQYALLEYASGAPIQFSYKELQKSTKGFKEKLGAGGFGAVYKAILTNRCVAAVKKLEGIVEGEKQFRMEVATISSTHHLNLVRLIGFCSEGRHRLLVYEFMKNGSLDNFLFVKDAASGRLLDWQTRFSIALGTARGVMYLHEECRDCIVHCDIKPENILLDDSFNSKVSDFGLAKLTHSKDHRTLSSVRGTRGYLAPEWLANLPITAKSDVYSYGMVLLEIVSGRRNFEVSEETKMKKFSVWAYEEYERGNMKNVVDKRLAEHEMEMEQVKRAIKVSFWCMQEQPSQRPTMGKVVQMLEGIIEIKKLPIPKNVTEGSNFSSISAISTFAASAQAPFSLSSSLQLTNSSFVSGRKIKLSSSLIGSD